MEEKGKTVDFEDAAARHRSGVTSEMWTFIWRNKRWWMIPMIVVLMLLGLVVLLGSTGVGALVYPLF